MRSPTASRLAFVAAFAALLALGYGHTLGYPYHYDDFYSIPDNPALHSPGDLGEIWRFRPSRVVTHLSLAWNLAIADSPTSLRVVNVVIHAATSLLVGWIAAAVSSQLASTRALRAKSPADRTPLAGPRAPRGVSPTEPPAGGGVRRRAPRALPGRDPTASRVGASAALLFVAHPLATQAVTYIIQRGTALAALLELVAVAAFLRARAGAPTRWWIVSWSAALLGGLTKEMSVALPALVLLTEAILRGGSGPGSAGWKLLAPYFLVLPLVGLTASQPATALSHPPVGFVETNEVGRTTYLLTQLTVIPRYLRLFVWPSGQSLDHDVRWIDHPGAWVLLGAGVVLGLVLVAIATRRRCPLVTLGLGWCLVALMPESSLIPIRDAMVEHRMYLPMAGLVWAAAAVLEAAATWRVLRTAGRAWFPRAALVVALALATVTHARNRVWRDELSLWTDASVRAPRKARPHNNRGMALDELGRVAEAETAYRRAIAVESLNVSARINLSRLYGTQRRFVDAIQILGEAERIEPEIPAVLHNLGSAWSALGDSARAAVYYERERRAGAHPLTRP